MKKWVDIALKFKYFILAISAFCWLLFEHASLEKEGRIPEKKFKNFFFNRNKKSSALHRAHCTISSEMVLFEEMKHVKFTFTNRIV
jgi:hypothetical protein